MTVTTRNASKPRGRIRGFTLVEILVVVVIIGVLAAIVIPQFAAATDEARHNAFITDLNAFTRAMMHYTAVDSFPPDSNSGVLPAELDEYIDANKFEAATPLGGVWDIEFEDSGVTSAIGVHFNNSNNPGDELMEVIDGLIDDGDLSSGGFQKIADDRYYNIIR